MLLEALFWESHSPDDKTLLAQLFGLCSITSTERKRAVYMSPVAAAAVCEALKNSDEPRQVAVVAAVHKLCAAILAFLHAATAAESDAAYGSVLAHTMVCRALTSRDRDVAVNDLVGCDWTQAELLPDRCVFVRGLCECPNVSSPRVAVKRSRDTSSSVAQPIAPQYAFLPPGNSLCAELMMLLPFGKDWRTGRSEWTSRDRDSPTKCVTLLFQSGQQAQCPADDESTLVNYLASQMNWTAEAAKNFAVHSDVVRVVVAPSKPSVSSEATALAMNEQRPRRCTITITHDEVRQWCPMVAHAVCDAHAVQSDASAETR